MKTYQPIGKYYEEFEIGEEYVTPARTITEADLVIFSGLSGDYNPVHTNKEYAKKTIFRERIAHGLLGLAIANGLFVRLGIEYNTARAFLDLNWKFNNPIKIGDTLYAKVIVSEKRESKSISDQGIITFDVNVFNQRDENVQCGRWVKLMIRKER